MRFLHTADWHVGRQLAGRSFLDDQDRVFTEIAEVARTRRVDAIVIAGDLYDRANPAEDAVGLLDRHLAAMCDIAPVIAIAGNHDSGPRVDFGRSLMREGRLHLSGTAWAQPETVRLCDDHGDVSFHLMPYATPEQVRSARQDPSIRSHEDATRRRIDAIAEERSNRAVLVGHLFATGGQATESSERDISVGGVSMVPLDVFESFQYTALGHLHRPHALGDDRRVRYAGSPIAYSFGETGGAKGVSIVELDGVGGITVEEIDLLTAPRLEVLTGTFDEVRDRLGKLSAVAAASAPPTLIRIELEDAIPIPDAFSKLRSVHRDVLELAFTRSAVGHRVAGTHRAADVQRRSPQEFLANFLEEAFPLPAEGEADADTALIAEIHARGRSIMERVIGEGGVA